MITTCPHCNANLDGGSILETFIKQRGEGVKRWQGMSDGQIEDYTKEFYSPPYRWNRIMSVIDKLTGRTFFMCPDCEKEILNVGDY